VFSWIALSSLTNSDDLPMSCAIDRFVYAGFCLVVRGTASILPTLSSLK